MAPRTATRPVRENDFSDVGKVGRRTGVTLPQGRLDVNGMEEISGIFSSPRKPSPLRKSTVAADSAGENNISATPSQALSARKVVPPPRSASPRKSGISGTARRSRVIDVLGQNKDRETPTTIIDEAGKQTPLLLASAARRFSPEKTPLKSITRSTSQTAQTVKTVKSDRASIEDSVHESVETDQDSTEVLEATDIPFSSAGKDLAEDDFLPPAVGDEDESASVMDTHEDEDEEPALPPTYDDEDADQTFEPEARTKPQSREPTIANSRRKRKSETVDQEVEVEAISSPAAKRAKRISDQSTKAQTKDKGPKTQDSTSSPKSRGRPALKSKDLNSKISTQQESEIDNIVAKVKARPGQKKSLYILRRETPANDGTTHTRSGRTIVKPLAYWRNERCVFGGSPGGANIRDGARFPLNSIKEIIRTEEVLEKPNQKPKKSGKGKTKKVPQKRSASVEGEEEQEGHGQDEESDQESDQESDEDYADPDAEPWETERGIFRGPIAVWDPQHQSYGDEEEEVDIAYARASIAMREIKDSTFRYAKLHSSKFFGCGVVDLPAGGVKKTKNSRRMHMSFFVATGRVTVQVGPLNGQESRFSIGKGGWWQVPRGNQYSMENKLSKPARIFFSQACEPIPQADDD